MIDPEEGKMEMLDTFKSEQDAREKGYTEKFTVGQLISIKGCIFQVNNFVPEHNFMNLKLISNKIEEANMI